MATLSGPPPNSSRYAIRRDAVGLLVLAVTLTLIFAWQANRLGGWLWDYDEGVYLQWAWTTHDGAALYTDVWAAHPPAFIRAIAVAFDIMGRTVAAGRMTSLLFGTLGLIGAAWLAYQISGWLAAFFAMAAIAVTPTFSQWSRAVMTDLPAASLAALALAVAFRYTRNGRRWWLVLSGLIFALSLLVKPVMAPSGLALVAIILARPSDSRTTYLDLATSVGTLLLSITLPVSLCLIAYEPRAMWEQIWGMWWVGRAVYPLDWRANAMALWDYVRNQYPALLGLAAYGTVVLFLRHKRESWPVPLWLALTVASLLAHSPLWLAHHTAILLPPVGVLSGVAIGEMTRMVRSFGSLHLLQRGLAVGGLIFGTFYLTTLPDSIAANQTLASAPNDETSVQMARVLQIVTPPDSRVVCDDPIIAFQAGRKSVNWLCDTSHKRIQAGFLSDQEAIAATEVASPSAIVLSSGRLSMLSEFTQWVFQRYEPFQIYHGGRRIMVPSAEAALQRYLPQVSWEGKLGLEDYKLEPTTVHPGETISLILRWRALQPMSEDYVVFVHLIDALDSRWAQVDRQPTDGIYPTSRWATGEIIEDRYEVPVPNNTPPGRYQFRIGLYTWPAVERLRVVDAEGNALDDSILLPPIQVW